MRLLQAFPGKWDFQQEDVSIIDDSTIITPSTITHRGKSSTSIHNDNSTSAACTIAANLQMKLRRMDKTFNEALNTQMSLGVDVHVSLKAWLRPFGMGETYRT